MGAIIRCADAFALDAVILAEGCAEWLNPKVLRSSMGSCFHVPIASDVSADEIFEWLGAQGVAPVAAIAHGGEDAAAFAPPEKWALVLGGEAAGLPDEILSRCAGRLTLATPGRAESLNVAVSAGIIMHLLTR